MSDTPKKSIDVEALQTDIKRNVSQGSKTMPKPKPKTKPTMVENLEFDMTLIPFYHEIANQEPLMMATVKRIARSMMLHGFRKDRRITMYKGQILDGRTRYVAATTLGIEPLYTEFKGTYEEAQEESDNLNVDRRDPTKSQKAMICARSIVEYRENIALAKSELKEKYPNISQSALSKRWNKLDINIRNIPPITPESEAKKRNVSDDYIKKCIKYLNYADVDLTEMCDNIFNGELEIYQAEEKYQNARQGHLAANRIARQPTDEEALLYEKMALVKNHPESAAREIIQLMQEIQEADDNLHIQEQRIEALEEIAAEVSVLRSFADDVEGKGKPVPLAPQPSAEDGDTEDFTQPSNQGHTLDAD